jgi:hypothetical protein
VDCDRSLSPSDFSTTSLLSPPPLNSTLSCASSTREGHLHSYTPHTCTYTNMHGHTVHAHTRTHAGAYTPIRTDTQMHTHTHNPPRHTHTHNPFIRLYSSICQQLEGGVRSGLVFKQWCWSEGEWQDILECK